MTTGAVSKEILVPEQINVPPVVVDLVKLNAYSIRMERIVSSISIDCDEENVAASSTLIEIKKFTKDVEAARKATLSPLVDLTGRINNMYRPITDSLAKSLEIISAKTLAYNTEKERMRKIEEKRLADEHKAAVAAEAASAKKAGVEPTFVEPPTALMPERMTRSDNGSTTIQKAWKGSVADPMEIIKAIAAGHVSISIVDFKQIELNNFAKAKKVEGVFNGIKVYEHSTVVART
jgi:hypothetical protein